MPRMSTRRIFASAAAALALTATGPTLAAGNLAAMDCAALGREAAQVQQEQMKLFSSPGMDPQKLGKEMSRIGERGGAIQKQKEAKRCPGAVIDNNDRGK